MSDHRYPAPAAPTTARSESPSPSELQMKYCFLCDQSGPHFTALIGDELVFQCHSCFATHADHVPMTGVGASMAGSGRHRLV